MNDDLEAVANGISSLWTDSWEDQANRKTHLYKDCIRISHAALLADQVRREVMAFLEQEVANLGTLDQSIETAKTLLARMRAQTEDDQ